MRQYPNYSVGVQERRLGLQPYLNPDHFFWGEVSKQPAKAINSTCPFRKLYPDVSVMQSSQDGNDGNISDPLDSSL